MGDRDLLEDTKRIVTTGWHQGDNTDRRGNFCLRAALGLACGEMEVNINGDLQFAVLEKDSLGRTKSFVRLLELVTNQLPEPYESIPLFNDAADTTKDDVLAVLDKAISSC